MRSSHPAGADCRPLVSVPHRHSTSVAPQLQFALCQRLRFFVLFFSELLVFPLPCLFCVHVYTCVCVCAHFQSLLPILVCRTAADRNTTSVRQALFTHRSLVIPVVRSAELRVCGGAGMHICNEMQTRLLIP